MKGIKRTCDYAQVTKVSDEFLKESNSELKLERAQLRFQFVGGGSGVGASGLIASVDTSNGGSKLIDLATIEGESTAKKCKAVKSRFDALAKATTEEIAKAYDKDESELTKDEINSYRYPKFTVYVATISELTNGEHTHVNNGERNYPTLSTTYLNEHDDKEEAFAVLKAELDRRISQGDYEFGKVDEGEEDE